MKQGTLSIFKQLGKSLCYYGLFLGIQVIAGFMFSLAVGILIGFKSGLTGEMPSSEDYTLMVSQMLQEGTGLLVILYTIPGLLLLWLFFLIRGKKLTRESGMVSYPVSLLPPVILLALGLTFFLNTVLNLLPQSWLESYSESSSALGQGPFFPMLIATGICAPFFEEIIFRGLILSRLKKAMPLWVAMVISSLLFGLAHGHPVWIAYAFCLGMAFCFVAERTGSIWTTILIHAIFNSFGTCLTYSEFQFTAATFIIMLSCGILFTIGGFYLLVLKTKKAEVITEVNHEHTDLG